MKLTVCFSRDANDIERNDESLVIDIPKDKCLFCCCDHDVNRFMDVVEQELARQFQVFDVTIFKVYAVD